MTSETTHCRTRVNAWLTAHLPCRLPEAKGIDIGAGGDPLNAWCWTLDLPAPYTAVGATPQILRGTVRDLSMFCDSALDYIYTSHLLEDFHYPEMCAILRDFARILRPGGHVLLYLPDEPIYRAQTSPLIRNRAHKEPDLCCEIFRRNVVAHCPPLIEVHANPHCETYSWEMILRKPEKTP